MNDATSPSDQRPPPQHGSPDTRPDAPDDSPQPPPSIPDNHAYPENLDYPDYYKRGPTLLASLGDVSWTRRAERERMARQRKEQDTEYIHRWVVKDSASAQTPTIAKDAQALANTWGQAPHRSADEPSTIFSPSGILFNAPESGGDNFRYPPDWDENKAAGRPAGYGSCNTDMMPYNQLVAATVLVIKYHLGDDVIVRSDGAYNSGTWNAAVNLYLRTFPERKVPLLDNWPYGSGRNW